MVRILVRSAYWRHLSCTALRGAAHTDGTSRLGIQLAPNHVPPEWPDGTPQQIHLDLFVEDVKAAHDEAMSLGARLLKPAEDVESAECSQVYLDPAGHPCCLCWR